MAGFKDKDLMQDTGGKTKVQKNYGGQHKRPPRTKQRNEQRNRFLKKEDKLDMNKQSIENQEGMKKVNSEQLDLQIGQNGQVYVKDQPTENSVMTFSDLVNIPSQVKNIREYDDFNTSLNNSMNDDSRYDVQINQDTQQQNVTMDEFDFNDNDSPQIVEQADVSNDDMILSDDQKQQSSNPFDDLFNKDEEQEETQQEDEEQVEQEKTQQEDEEYGEQEETEDSNDSIDEYLNMEIDDSKLSEQNKKKLDSFTTQQMDAFKKFLYQKKNQEQ